VHGGDGEKRCGAVCPEWVEVSPGTAGACSDLPRRRVRRPPHPTAAQQAREAGAQYAEETVMAQQAGEMATHRPVEAATQQRAAQDVQVRRSVDGGDAAGRGKQCRSRPGDDSVEARGVGCAGASKEEDKEERTWAGPTGAGGECRRRGIAASYPPGEKHRFPLETHVFS
jgi:hypothetical protein